MSFCHTSKKPIRICSCGNAHCSDALCETTTCLNPDEWQDKQVEMGLRPADPPPCSEHIGPDPSCRGCGNPMKPTEPGKYAPRLRLGDTLFCCATPGCYPGDMAIQPSEVKA